MKLEPSIMVYVSNAEGKHLRIIEASNHNKVVSEETMILLKRNENGRTTPASKGR